MAFAAELIVAAATHHVTDKRHRVMTMDQSNSQCIAAGPVPLVIGITGHRDIPEEDRPELKKQIQNIYDDLQAQYLSTPFVLISPLAEGADQIAAEVALEKGMQLVVPLPLPRAEYERGFQVDAAREAFARHLARASVVLEIPLVKGNTPDSIRVQGPARYRQYFSAGMFVVEHCQILIALWDGTFNDKVGGTSDIVELQLLGDTARNDTEEIIFTPLQTGPVYHVITRRKSTDAISTRDRDFMQTFLPQGAPVSFAPFSRNILYPLHTDTRASLKAEQERIFACIEEFNRDVANPSDEFSRQVAQSADWLIPLAASTADDGQATLKSGVSGPFTQSDLSRSEKGLLGQFALADALAIRYQKDTYAALKAIACFVPLIVFFFEMYMGVSSALPVILGYLALLSGTYGIYYWSKERRNQEKYLDYRALAEGMRVQFSWKLAGLKESVASDYLSKQQSELDWIRQTIRNWNLLAADSRPSGCRRGLEAARERWVRGQAAYFGKAAARQKKQTERLERIAKIVFMMAMFVLTPAMLAIHGLKIGGEELDQWMQVVTPFAFIVAGAVNYFKDKMLYASQVKQYSRMGSLFRKALTLLEKSPNDAELCRDILVRLGKEAVVENGDWILMHRERPIEVPQG
jgi:hypothetical protein